MTMFAHFNAGGRRPLNQWEADEMSSNGEYVFLYTRKPNNSRELIATIRLEKGQSVARLDSVQNAVSISATA